MLKAKLWTALQSHPGSAWREPADPPLPELNAAARLLWCGTGGSLLPGQALVPAFGPSAAWLPLASPEPAPLELRPGDQVVFASRSGRTLELWTWIGRLRAMKGWNALERPPVAVTLDDGNPLARWARREGFPLVPAPPGAGGAYTAFTPAGTLPLAWMGRDAQAFLQGGREVAQDAPEGLGHWGARIWGMVETLHEGYLAGIQQWALVPHGAGLAPLTGWWAQLLAESLGHVAREGTRRGVTPIPAVGPVDLHAQLQRWLAGPRNLGVILVTLPAGGRERLKPPAACPWPGLSGLAGARILAAQAEAAREALEDAGVPVVQWELEPLGERSLGEFMMAWQLIAALTAFALELDPFARPEVEDWEARALKRLGL
jgi:glucose-6-phosphate isomerase